MQSLNLKDSEQIELKPQNDQHSPWTRILWLKIYWQPIWKRHLV